MRGFVWLQEIQIWTYNETWVENEDKIPCCHTSNPSFIFLSKTSSTALKSSSLAASWNEKESRLSIDWIDFFDCWQSSIIDMGLDYSIRLKNISFSCQMPCHVARRAMGINHDRPQHEIKVNHRDRWCISPCQNSILIFELSRNYRRGSELFLYCKSCKI